MSSDLDSFTRNPWSNSTLRADSGRFLTKWTTWHDARLALAVDLPLNTVARLDLAWQFAETAHGPQQRPCGGNYTNHLVECVEILYLGAGVRDMITLTGALLHDVAEDTSHTLADIRAEFGSLIADAVAWLTLPHVTGAARDSVRAAAFARLASAPTHIKQIKLADRLSAIQRLDTQTPFEKQGTKYRETCAHIIPLARQFPWFAHEYAKWRSAYAYVAERSDKPDLDEEQLLINWGRSPILGRQRIIALLRLLRAAGLSDVEQRVTWRMHESRWRWLGNQPLPHGAGWRDELHQIILSCQAQDPEQCLFDLAQAYEFYMGAHQQRRL